MIQLEKLQYLTVLMTSVTSKWTISPILIFSANSNQKNQNIIQEGHFWKFLENVLVWAYQVAFRDLKNTNNSVAVDSQLNVLAFFPKCA